MTPLLDELLRLAAAELADELPEDAFPLLILYDDDELERGADEPEEYPVRLLAVEVLLLVRAAELLRATAVPLLVLLALETLLLVALWVADAA